jgi:two-component system sensor histidine kinase KdpD
LGFEDLLERRNKGFLKIYLGFAAGVGKTYAMLAEAHRLKERGYDVVVGYVEPHARPDTIKLMERLEAVVPVTRAQGPQALKEMNLPGILHRKPQVVLIDELAHTNAPGGKNEKRYQDVLEILDAGINVISTLNVQHLESVAEKVHDALQVPVAERVPDYLLQRADQIVNVDVSIEELRERLRMGKIYAQDKAEQALLKFFTHENLSLLRKLALQQATEDQLRKIEEDRLLAERGTKEADEAVLVAMSSDPSNAEAMIRKGTKLASQLSARCYVVYIQKREESPDRIDAALQRKLLSNLKLAQTLGAEVVRLQGDNISDVLVNFAQTHHVRHAVFGKTRRSPIRDRLFGSVVQDFMHDSVGVDVHIVSFSPVRKEDA